MRRFVRQTRAGFIALASVAALIHLVGVANTPGRVSTLAHGAGRGDDALTFLGPGARRRVLSSHENCAAGKKWNAAADSGNGLCVDCDEGETSAGGVGATCSNCAAGKYSDAGMDHCGCAPGTYGPIGSSTCIDCAAGSVTDTVAQLGASTCTPCAAGQFSAAPTVACADCASGRYAGSASAADCIDCAAGKYVASSGAASASYCRDCAAGSYAASAGSAACVDCGAGSVTDTGAEPGVIREV